MSRYLILMQAEMVLGILPPDGDPLKTVEEAWPLNRAAYLEFWGRINKSKPLPETLFRIERVS